jgi:hypothetical protein
VKYIELTKGQRAIVDDEDYEELSQWRWYCSVGGTGGNKGASKGYAYAVRTVNWRENGKPKSKKVYMSVWLMRPTEGMVVNYINGDTLDCRRNNLRLATKQDDARYRHNNYKKMGYKGVFKFNRCKKWRSSIRVDGVLVNLGNFDTPEEAAKAYDAAALEHYGEFALLNFNDL